MFEDGVGGEGGHVEGGVGGGEGGEDVEMGGDGGGGGGGSLGEGLFWFSGFRGRGLLDKGGEGEV